MGGAPAGTPPIPIDGFNSVLLPHVKQDILKGD